MLSVECTKSGSCKLVGQFSRDRSTYTNRTVYIRLTATNLLTPMMTSAQVVETSVNPSQDYTIHLIYGPEGNSSVFPKVPMS